jgi:hypothetical protein
MRKANPILSGRRVFVVGLVGLMAGSGLTLPAYSADDFMTSAQNDHGRPLESVEKRGGLVSSKPRTTTDGVLPLDEPIAIKVKGVLLRVPAAFISPWPHAAARNRISESSTLRFEFWMPDKRYLEINPISNADFRPREPGRGEPSRDSYTVRIWDLQSIKLSEPEYISPEQAFLNETKSRQPPGSQYVSHEEEFGLVRFWPRDEPEPKYKVEYRNKQDSDPQILLGCVVPDRWRVFPECSGRVHFIADDLAFFVVFPREEVSHWQSIVLAARELYKSWIVHP